MLVWDGFVIKFDILTSTGMRNFAKQCHPTVYIEYLPPPCKSSNHWTTIPLFFLCPNECEVRRWNQVKTCYYYYSGRKRVSARGFDVITFFAIFVIKSIVLCFIHCLYLHFLWIWQVQVGQWSHATFDMFEIESNHNLSNINREMRSFFEKNITRKIEELYLVRSRHYC